MPVGCLRTAEQVEGTQKKSSFRDGKAGKCTLALSLPTVATNHA